MVIDATDQLHERRIAAYCECLSKAHTMEERRQYWELLQAAVKALEVAQVKRMEREIRT
jgi:hypothetical protein